MISRLSPYYFRIILLSIFLLALFLRLYRLGDLPNGFYEEEVTNAYVGRFIIQNGKDLYGNRWPILYFDKFGDYPPVLPMYITGLATYIFGTSVFAARFSIALIGALTIFPVWALAFFIWKNRLLASFSALILAILPWHVVLSRTSAEGIIGFAMYTIGILWIIQGIGRTQIHLFKRVVVVFIFSYFLHPALRLLIPLTLLPVPFFIAHKSKRRGMIMIVLFFFLLTLVISITVWGRGRFVQTSIFQSDEIAMHIGKLNESLSYDEGGGNVRTARLFHNKGTGYTREIIKQYFSYFSPANLFLEAGGQPRYYNAPHQGLLYITLALLLFLGLLPQLVPRTAPYSTYLVYLLAIAPVPSVLTVDFVPHAHRSLFMILPFVLLATNSLSKIQILLRKQKRLFLLVFLVMLVALFTEFIYFWHEYSRHEASQQSILRNGGDKELVHSVIENESKYEKVIMPMFARLPVYYLYFSGNFDPSLAGQFRSELKIDSVGKIQFFTDWCPTKYLKTHELSHNTLVIDNGDCQPNGSYTLIDQISRRDSTRAYRLLTPR